MQVKTPHAWPGPYASAAFRGGLTGAMACPLPICRRATTGEIHSIMRLGVG